MSEHNRAPAKAGSGPALCPHGVPLGPGQPECPICRAEQSARHSGGALARNWLIILGAIAVIGAVAIWLA